MELLIEPPSACKAGASQLSQGPTRPLKLKQDSIKHSVFLERSDPAAPSDTVTLVTTSPLIIYPTLGGWPLKGYLTDFVLQTPRGVRRCVQGLGTYSPRRADPRLLAI